MCSIVDMFTVFYIYMSGFRELLFVCACIGT